MLPCPACQSNESYFHTIVCRQCAVVIARMRSYARRNRSVSCWLWEDGYTDIYISVGRALASWGNPGDELDGLNLGETHVSAYVASTATSTHSIPQLRERILALERRHYGQASVNGTHHA